MNWNLIGILICEGIVIDVVCCNDGYGDSGDGLFFVVVGKILYYVCIRYWRK